MEHVDLLLLLNNSVDYAVDVRLAAIKQVPEVTILWRHRARLGLFRRVRMASLRAIPGKSRVRRACVNPVIEAGKIPLCAGHDLNSICRARLRNPRRTPRRRGLVLAWTAPIPGGCLRERRRGLRYRGVVDTRRHSGRWPRPCLSP